MPMPLLAVIATTFSCMTNEVASGTVAAMRCSTLRMRSTGWFLATMKRTDSGRRRAISTVKTNGVVPPRTSTLRQPHCGIIQAARKPPKAAPAKHGVGERSTSPIGAILAHQGYCVGHGGAKPNARDETPDNKLVQ